MKLNILLWILLCTLLVPVMVIAAEPPSIEHHQFYGRVTWDLDSDVPENVVASVNGVEYSSSISIVTCDTNPCTGKYGNDVTNYLRVHGEDGNTIAFYVDDTLIDTLEYESWGVTRHDVSTSSSVITCDQRWDCDEWLSCVAATQTRTCTDVNECDTDESTKTEQKTCVAGTLPDQPQTLPACVYVWDCTSWSSCSNEIQTRSCQRSDDCDAQLSAGTISSVTQFPQPAETKVCGTVSGRTAPSVIPSTTRDVVEDDKDVSEGVSTWYYVAGIILLLVAILILVFFFRSRSKGNNGSGNQYSP